ncbi:MAG: glycosyltransferase family 4 protein [Aquimonas sp.]|nr:glycosyltransferase family 4 protein [Aquimonas sp.]
MSSDAQVPRRLLLVAPYFLPRHYGGAVVVYRELFAQLPGWEVHVAAPSGPGCDDTDRALLRQGLHVHRVPGVLLDEQPGAAGLRLFRSLLGIWQARAALLRLRAQLAPDLLICGNVLELSWMAVAGRALQPDLNYVHGEELSLPSLGRGVAVLLKRLRPRLLRAARLNLAVSEPTRRSLLAFGLDDTRVRLLPNFVDCRHYQPADDLPGLRAALGLRPGPVFLALARMVRRKGLDDLLRALAELRVQARLPASFQLRLVGEGPELVPLQQLAESLGLEGQVLFRGRLSGDDALRELQACDALVMPNKNINGDDEGFGLVFLEANACGKPVLGGASGGVPDAIEDEVSGLLARPGDIEHIAAQLARLIESPELRQALGCQGLERARRRFDLQARRAQLRQLLDAMAGEVAALPTATSGEGLR